MPATRSSRMRGRAAISLVLIVFTIFVVNVSLVVAAIADGPAEAGEPAPRPATRAASGGKLKLAAAPTGAVTGPETGTLLLCSVSSSEIRAAFLKLAGGSEARIVMVVNHVPVGGDPVDAERRAAEAWGVAKVTFWRLTNRQSAEDKALLEAIGHATGVWIPGGKPPEYLDALIDSSAHRALAALLARGGVIGGESAGAVVQSTFVALPPGAPYAGPALKGLGFARNLVIFPHFGASAKFPPQFCERLVAEHQGLAGLALPDGSAVIVRARSVEVVGKGHVDLIWRATDGHMTTTTHASATHFTLPEDTK